jgi:hypothetical protein
MMTVCAPYTVHIERDSVLRTIYGGQEPSRNRVFVPDRQATQAGGIDSSERLLAP